MEVKVLRALRLPENRTIRCSPSPLTFTCPSHERKPEMATKICGFPSRRWAAFFLGVLVGTVVVGCSMFGPGIGASVY